MMINQFFNQTGIYQEYFIYEEMEKEESTNEASLWKSNIVLIWSVILGIFWSERSVCAAFGCWHKRRWPLFLVIFHLLLSYQEHPEQGSM